MGSNAEIMRLSIILAKGIRKYGDVCLLLKM